MRGEGCSRCRVRPDPSDYSLYIQCVPPGTPFDMVQYTTYRKIETDRRLCEGARFLSLHLLQ